MQSYIRHLEWALCLGVVVFFALVPLAGYLLVQAYASV